METAIRGDVAGDWSGEVDIDARVMDELTDEWTEDLDMSLEPAPQRVARPESAPRRRWGLVLAALVALLGVLVVGTAFVVVVLAAAAVVAALVLVPVSTIPEAPPVLDQPTIEMVTPVIVDVPATVVPDEQPPAKPRKRAPAADPGKSDAKLVVMPDPAFRARPADEAIDRLRKKVDRGEAGTVVGK